MNTIKSIVSRYARWFSLLALILFVGLPLAVLLSNKQPIKSRAQQASPESTPFVHPGIHVNKAQLDFVKEKIAAGEQPWLAAYTKAKNSAFGSLQYVPHPRAIVECGAYNNPSYGCLDETNDATAAYTHALLWYYTGNSAHAHKSIEIMNAWSAVLQDHTNSNAPLQTAWSAELFVKSAEIIRYTSAGWTDTDIQQFTSMLNTVFLRNLNDSASIYASNNGNWHLSAIDAKLIIAVFTDNRILFDEAISDWRARVPAYLYIRTDNNSNGLPIPPPGGQRDTVSRLTCFWLNNTSGYGTLTTLSFEDGHAQETCRDQDHTSMGFGSMINAAETAYLQGIDLYSEQSTRIVKALEYNTQFINGQPYPSGFCYGAAVPIATRPMPTFEVAYNHFNGRMKLSLPNTKRNVDWLRAGGGAGWGNQLAWETLTHGETGTANHVTITLTPKPSPTTALTATPTVTPTLTPVATPFPPTPTSINNGLSAIYFNNVDFTGTSVSRIDATVNFNWGTGAPVAGIASDTFSVRWTGYIMPIYSQTYRFYARTNDGVRLWINNTQLINNWKTQSTTEVSGTIALTAGKKYPITMEYYDNWTAAVAELRWSSASQAKQLIPRTQLYRN